MSFLHHYKKLECIREEEVLGNVQSTLQNFDMHMKDGRIGLKRIVNTPHILYEYVFPLVILEKR